jgi:hypothetical protein
LAQVPLADDPASAAVRDTAIGGLVAFYEQPLGPGSQLIQAQCPVAIAALASGSHPRRHEFCARFGDLLRNSLRPVEHGESKTNDHVFQSCAIAIGMLAHPWDDAGSPDAALGKLLVEVYRNHRDHQTRYFAAMALGRMGGKESRKALLLELERGTRAIEQPWIALGFGIPTRRPHARARLGSRRGLAARPRTGKGTERPVRHGHLARPRQLRGGGRPAAQPAVDLWRS